MTISGQKQDKEYCVVSYALVGCVGKTVKHTVYPSISVEGVGVMKDEEPKLEEIETSHTLLGWIGEMLH